MESDMETFKFVYHQEKIFQDISKYRKHYLEEIIRKYENPDCDKPDYLINIKTLKAVNNTGDTDVSYPHFGTLSTTYSCEPAQKLIEQMTKEKKNIVKNQNFPKLGKNIHEGKKASVIAVRRKPKLSNVKPEGIGEKRCQDSISELKDIPLDVLGHSSKVLDGSGKVYDDMHNSKKLHVAVKRKEFPAENSCKNVSFDKSIANQRNSKSYNNMYNLKKQCIEDIPRKDEFSTKIPCNREVSSADSAASNSQPSNNVYNMKKVYSPDKQRKDKFHGKTSCMKEVPDVDPPASNNISKVEKLHLADKQMEELLTAKSPQNEEVSCGDATSNLSNSTSSNCVSVLTEPCTKNRKRKFTRSDYSPGFNSFLETQTTYSRSHRS